MDFAKLRNRPVEPGTTILKEQEEVIGGHPCILEFWVWQGISAMSAIFLASDVGEMKKRDLISFYFNELKLPVDEEATVKKSGEFVFINYSFQSTDD